MTIRAAADGGAWRRGELGREGERKGAREDCKITLKPLERSSGPGEVVGGRGRARRRRVAEEYAAEFSFPGSSLLAGLMEE